MKVPELKLSGGKDSIFRRCLYGDSLHNYQFNYTMQFWEAYPNNRKFFRTHLSDNHEFFGIQVHYVDEDLARFFQEFYDRGYMKDTVVMFLSDHGSHPFSFHFGFIPDNSRRVEMYMAMLFNIVPNDLQPEYIQNLKDNEQSFISSFDVYASLKTIAENKQGKSRDAVSYPYMFTKMPSDHDCTNKSEFIANCWCMNDKNKVMKQYNSQSPFYFSF